VFKALFDLLVAKRNEIQPTAISTFMNDEWTETLRCPKCGKSGIAKLSQDMSEDGSMPTAGSVPKGFTLTVRQGGPTFHCASCKVEVIP
jgi:predicted RNA-binding Zn-ribbon protein involved in translation (DUF1610 family)